MKRKSLFLLLALLLCTCLVFALASCEEELPPEEPEENEQPEEEAPGEHVHAFGNWTVIKTATCGAKGQRLRICSCGEREYATDFATGNHRYGANNTCVVCNNAWEFYEDLSYELNADGLSYTITGYSGSIGEILSLPCFYNGLPVTAIGTAAFRGVDGLTELNLTDMITYIGDSAFENCTALATVRFEKNSHLTAIGNRAFAKTALTAFEIPANVIAVGVGVFAECSYPTLTVAEGNSRYTVSKNGSLVDAASGTLLCAGSNGEIPTDVAVTTIAPYAFAGCGENIKITAKITTIAPNAFADYKGTEVTFAKTEGWLVSQTNDPEEGVPVVIGETVDLAVLTDTYADYYWFYIAPDAE